MQPSEFLGNKHLSRCQTSRPGVASESKRWSESEGGWRRSWQPDCWQGLTVMMLWLGPSVRPLRHKRVRQWHLCWSHGPLTSPDPPHLHSNTHQSSLDTPAHTRKKKNTFTHSNSNANRELWTRSRVTLGNLLALVALGKMTGYTSHTLKKSVFVLSMHLPSVVWVNTHTFASYFIMTSSHWHKWNMQILIPLFPF